MILLERKLCEIKKTTTIIKIIRSSELDVSYYKSNKGLEMMKRIL
jgi:hypothetical protein